MGVGVGVGGIFLVHYFSGGGGCKRDITCNRAQTHKGMLLKYAGSERGGGEVFLRGGGGDQFCQTTTLTTPGRK